MTPLSGSDALRRAALAAATLGALAATRGAAAAEPPEPDRLQISIEFPGAGQRVGGVGGLGLLAGRVLAYQGRLDRYDLVFSIDVSGSTARPSGLDVDGDGQARGEGGLLRRVFGGKKKGKADNILGAELAAVRALLDQLDPRSTRVGVVIFSGDELAGTPDALVEVPLTDDYARVRKGLAEIALVPPEGATNMAAGLRVALAQLRPRKAGGSGVAEAQRYIVFLTDGEPMLPGKNARDLGEDALRVAREAAKRGVRILSFAVGPEAADRPEVASEAARITGGRFVAVRDLRNLSTEVAGVRFTALAGLALRNRTLDAPPACQIVTPEGRFAALLPMRTGANALEVRAQSTRQTEQTVEVDVEFTPGAPLVSALGDALRDDLVRLRTLCERETSPSERNVQIEPEH